MPKDIKIKEKDTHSIRKLDRSVAFTSRVKRSMSEQYDKLKKEDKAEQNIENSNATNYATSKVMRTGDRGTKEGAYVITGVSKTTYKKVKMKISEYKEKKNNISDNEKNIEKQYSHNFNHKNRLERSKDINDKDNRENVIKTRNYSGETNVSNSDQNIQSYQKQKYIKEKQNHKKIKEHNYRNNGIKANNNSIKIKTRDNSINSQNIKFNNHKIKVHKPDTLMKNAKVQNIKRNSIRIKNIAQKVGKVASNVAKKLAQRTKRNRNVNSFWRWICCNNNYHSFNYCRYVWFSIWFLIF